MVRVFCPFCHHRDSRVLDSRVADDGASIRRRRQCPSCERRFTTVEQMQLVVVKKSGVVEPFSRDKVVAGVRKACAGRPVTDDDLARLGQQVEEALRAAGCAEVATEEVGIAILKPLSALDPVAYMRFASVYKHFRSLDDFEAEIADLRGGPAATGFESTTSRDAATSSHEVGGEPAAGGRRPQSPRASRHGGGSPGASRETDGEVDAQLLHV